MKYKVVIEPCDEGGFAVHCPALRGCWSQGETVEDALENIRDAIETYLRSQEEVLKEKQTYDVDVAV